MGDGRCHTAGCYAADAVNAGNAVNAVTAAAATPADRGGHQRCSYAACELTATTCLRCFSGIRSMKLLLLLLAAVAAKKYETVQLLAANRGSSEGPQTCRISEHAVVSASWSERFCVGKSESGDGT